MCRVSKTYTCANCLENYEYGWSEEEASAEFSKMFPEDNIEDADIVCDDCYKALGFGTENI